MGDLEQVSSESNGGTLISIQSHSQSPKMTGKQEEKYLIFSEQYLEKPYFSMGFVSLSATVCTWRGIPTIDDPDVD